MKGAIVDQVPPLAASPGQFFLSVPPSLDPYLPVIAWPFRIREGRLASVLTTSQALGWWKSRRATLRGPYGRPFNLTSRSKRILILAQDTDALARIMPFADAAIESECETTVVSPPDDEIEHWLSPEIEFRVSDQPLLITRTLFSWADLIIAAGTSDFYDALHAEARGIRLRLEQGWGMLLLSDVAIGCGTGLCQCCLVKTRRGNILACRDGPTMDLADWFPQQ